MSELADSRRLAKNTIYLYIRTLVVMLITLYTSRVVLQVLGASDFGIYNVVGGIVIMFSFISGALATATQRFLSFALGKNDMKECQDIFCMSLITYYAIAVIIVILAELIGLPFMITQMNFPEDRWTAVHWVYQLSILSFCLTIIRTPYTASIIAYEKMTFYAYISIIENVLKLLVVFLLMVVGGDKLIIYAILMTAVIGITNIIYYLWCKYNFQTCTFRKFWDRQLFNKLFSFSGWSMFGSLANIGANQGVNIIFNIFSGVLVNAAMGIASQVQSAVSSCVSGFQTAISPQLVKLYAAGENEKMVKMINQSSRLSYFLTFIFAMPGIFYCAPILKLWLVNVPDYSVSFSQLMIVFLMIDSMSAPLWFSVQATGKISHYQMLMGFMISLNIPIAYILLWMDFSPNSVLLAKVILNGMIHIVRVFYLTKLMCFSAIEYIKCVLSRVLLVTIASIPVVYIFINKYDTLLWSILCLVYLMVQNLFLVYFCGLEKKERSFVNKKVKELLYKYYGKRT